MQQDPWTLLFQPCSGPAVWGLELRCKWAAAFPALQEGCTFLHMANPPARTLGPILLKTHTKTALWLRVLNVRDSVLFHLLQTQTHISYWVTLLSDTGSVPFCCVFLSILFRWRVRVKVLISFKWFDSDNCDTISSLKVVCLQLQAFLISIILSVFFLPVIFVLLYLLPPLLLLLLLSSGLLSWPLLLLSSSTFHEIRWKNLVQQEAGSGVNARAHRCHQNILAPLFDRN